MRGISVSFETTNTSDSCIMACCTSRFEDIVVISVRFLQFQVPDCGKTIIKQRAELSESSFEICAELWVPF